MKKNYLFPLLMFVAILLAGGCTPASKYAYESVPGDPLKTRIYTLDNGLKVYLSVNKDKPRIQTFIGVRVGGKNDPAETTGLAHYFEHLMFKGTKRFGTSDYEAEKPLLDRIEALFETYRQTTGAAERRAIYAEIDSVAQEASRIAIPNEYDKLMSAIGSQGTNAFTSYDVTAYMEDIPANEVDTWAAIQADRFTDPVIRLFHTELETVYEEYNMSLTRDSRRVIDTLFAGLFPHHPYGTQTILGTQEHLKNPSITNIKKYFDLYYVPNNMAICMVGDLDPDQVIATIDNYFGALTPGEVPTLNAGTEQPITSPVVKEVVGLEAENVMLGFRLPGANTHEAATMEFIDYLLTNGKAGLIDLNLVQKQKLLRGGSSSEALADYTLFLLYGTPKEGQTLNEVRDLLLEQVDVLKKGDFDEALLEAVINNFRLERYYEQQEYQYAAQTLLFSFVNGIEWADAVHRIDFQSKITKQNVIAFANKYLNNNYAIVYKRQGVPSDRKIDKPSITPISTNRNNESQYLAGVKQRAVEPIEPVFVDYERDMTHLRISDKAPLLYTQNTMNPTFSLYYVFEMGNNHDKALGTAFNYLNYLGTSTQTAEKIKSELYRLACSFGVQATDDRVYVYISGLSDNFDKALSILEERLADAVADSDIYENLVADVLKNRADAKTNQGSNFSALRQYAVWGPKSPLTNILTEAELRELDPQALVERTKNLRNTEHTILYYGPLPAREIARKLEAAHALGDRLAPPPTPAPFVEQPTTDNRVLVAHYDAKQLYMSMFHRGGAFDRTIEADRAMYNEYFGGNMNSIVFQEMREARGLAYSASAGYQSPAKLDRSYYVQTFIATQNDKMNDAIDAFLSILNDMPESENAFAIARDAILTNIRTQRTLREQILWSYISAKEFGYDTDRNRELYERIPAYTLDDVKRFQQQYIKDKPYTYCILGDTKDLDFDALGRLGKVTVLSQEEIFGY
jgi:predicted Zn-dependent peptidase